MGKINRKSVQKKRDEQETIITILSKLLGQKIFLTLTIATWWRVSNFWRVKKQQHGSAGNAHRTRIGSRVFPLVCFIIYWTTCDVSIFNYTYFNEKSKIHAYRSHYDFFFPLETRRSTNKKQLRETMSQRIGTAFKGKAEILQILGSEKGWEVWIPVYLVNGFSSGSLVSHLAKSQILAL